MLQPFSCFSVAVPLISISILYTVIVRALVRKAIPCDDANQNSFQMKRYKHSQNIMRLFKSIVAVFVGCYLLYTMFLIIQATVLSLFLKTSASGCWVFYISCFRCSVHRSTRLSCFYLALITVKLYRHCVRFLVENAVQK